MYVRHPVNTGTQVSLNFHFFINCFSIKGQNGCVNRIMQTSARKTQTVVFPIQLNRNPKQVQQKNQRARLCPLTIGHSYKRKL